jgi:ketosteroid isomerase-like protein
MNSLRQLLIASLLAFFAPCQAEQPERMEPMNFVKSYEEALATQKWDQVAPLIHPNCTVTFSNGSCHQGKSKVGEAFRKNFDLIEDETYSISGLHWIIKSPDFAVFTYTYNWSGIIAGEKASGSGRGTSTIVFEDGFWLVVAEHLGRKD